MGDSNLETQNASFTRRGILNEPLPLLMVGALVALYFTYFVWPFIPIWVGSDEFGYVLDAARLWGARKSIKILRNFFPLELK